MGVYDFNMSSFNIDSIIAALRKDLQDIVVNSQISINEIKRKITEDEVLLNRLKTAVDNLPDYTAQYNELKDEITKLNLALDELIKHPIILDNIDVRGASGIISEVQKINGQFIYANHAVNDAQGNNIVDTYATKDELDQAEQRASTIEQSIIDDLTGEISRAMRVETSISTDLNAEVIRSTNKDTELQQNINTLSNTVNDKESALNAKIVAETTRATNKEAELETAISDEATARETAVSNLETDIANEAISRHNEIDVVANNLTEEVNRATEAEEALDSKIDSSVETLNGTISGLNTTFSQALTQEQNTRSAADTTLQTNITSARNDFTTALNTLDNAKQDNLTAGDGIDITNDIVSHSIKVIENNNEEDVVEGTVFTVYLKNNHYKMITFDKTITEIIFMIEKSATGVLQETGFEFTVPEDSELETLTFKVINDNNKKIYTIIPDSYSSPNIYQGTIVNYRCTIGEYEVED